MDFGTKTQPWRSGCPFRGEDCLFGVRVQVVHRELCKSQIPRWVQENDSCLKLDNVVRSAQRIMPFASLNEHFYTPQSVSSVYTGRTADLENLKHYLQAPASANQLHAQKRFVIYGLPGSGKTQFCCKFASDIKQRYLPSIETKTNSG